MLAVFRRKEAGQAAGFHFTHTFGFHKSPDLLPGRNPLHDALPERLVEFPVRAFLAQPGAAVIAGPYPHRIIRSISDKPDVIVT